MSVPSNPRAIVEIDGERFDSFAKTKLFKGVDVELTANESSQATWKIFDEERRFINQWSRPDGIARLDISVWLGFGDDLGAAIFTGLLANAECDDDTTTFEFYDKGYLMRRVKRTAYHKGLDDLGVIAKLVRANGLKFEGPDKPIKLDKHKSLIQDEQTDWEHARERADEAGLVLYVRGNTVYAKEAARTGEPKLIVNFATDTNLLHGSSFRYRAPENQDGAPKSVETRGRRLRGRSNVNARGTEQLEIKRDLAIKSKRHADRRAQARKELQREHAFTGRLGLLPITRDMVLDTRATVEVRNRGILFNGRYLTEITSHTFAPGQLQSELNVYRDANFA